MSIGHSPSLFSYTMNSTDQVVILDCASEKRDLGVLFTNNLKFSHHISAIVRKANSMTGMVKRTFNFLSPSTFRILCTSLVRPHIDYASVVWSPY